MEPGCAVDPHGGEEGQPDAELGQLTLPDLGEIGRRRGELAPADHGESLIQTPPEDQQIALDTVEAGDPGQVAPAREAQPLEERHARRVVGEDEADERAEGERSIHDRRLLAVHDDTRRPPPRRASLTLTPRRVRVIRHSRSLPPEWWGGALLPAKREAPMSVAQIRSLYASMLEPLAQARR